ncbi:MAG: hypothetical protein AB200_01700 [Parcubacteria bacterium C7867-005]|nr:MAG: hypothetical protein AB200_01700 [Parcubacteria bacterium C7867-005]
MQKIKNNKLVLIIALLVSLLVVSPHLIFLQKTGPAFQGVYQSFSDDEVYYQARIAEVLRGNWSIGNPYIKEHQADPFLQPPVAEWIVAILVWITGLSVPVVTIIGDVFFVFFGFLFLFIIFKRITKKKTLSLVYTSIFFLLFVSTFGRPVSPQVTIFFLFAGLLLIYDIYFGQDGVGSRKRNLHLFFGLVVGLSLFISPYYWTTLLVLYGLTSLSKKALWFLPTFLPLGFLYGVFTLRSSDFSGYTDAMARFGLFNSHFPGSYTSIVLGLLTLIILLFARKILSQKDWWLSLCFVASIFILNWQNIITGQVIQFSSHYLLVTILFILFVLAIIHKTLIDKMFDRRIFSAGVVLLIVLFFVQLGEFEGLCNSTFHQKISSDLQEKKEVFDWLNQNTPKDSVVLTLGGDFDFLLPVYTHNNVYYNLYATLSVMPDSETENRWLLQNLFNPQIDATYITQHQRDFWMNRYIDSYYSKENRRKISASLTGDEYVPETQISPDLINDLFKRFKEYKSQPPITAIQTYNLDYVILSKEYPHYAYAKGMLDRSKSIKKQEIIGDMVVYSVTR